MITQKSQLWTFICLAVAVISLAFSPIFIRLSEHELGAYGIIFNRFWITGLLLTLGSGVKRLWDKRMISGSNQLEEVYTTKDFIYLMVGSILETACQVTWAWSLTQTTIANSNLLHNTTPIFTVLAGWLFLKKSVSRRFLMGMVLAIAGTLIIGLQDFQLGADTWIGDSAALLSAIFYALTLLVIEHLRGKFSTTTILLWNCGGCTILLLPFTLLFEKHLFPISWHGWLYIAALALLCTIIGLGALLFTLKHLSSSFVSLVMLLEPVIAAFLAWAFFAEKFNVLTGLTFITVLSGIYLSQTDSASETAQESLLDR
ncbi:protein of unknown function DUF6 transmembrane [Rippkaea orientalis PCC 8801]|uniref:EamA domain-containing protein n=1 Tax=Rippkaea orientalis (strain PCC 8801 / RF-1) TaxID=41431 RepID=B7JZV1_RIPO1|nr:DMT family transporter [Rippkaea orientalis]ACK65044.1 protein of unknown function DUF6 transmembrane [Rippkaea orientalis PCC 8801]